MLFSFVLLALSACNVSGFPSHLSEALIQKRNADPAQVDSPCPHMAELAKRAVAEGSKHTKRQAPGVVPPFNAADQYVSNQGQHKFVAPGPTDQRGPCKYHRNNFEAKLSHPYL